MSDERAQITRALIDAMMVGWLVGFSTTDRFALTDHERVTLAEAAHRMAELMGDTDLAGRVRSETDQDLAYRARRSRAAARPGQ